MDLFDLERLARDRKAEARSAPDFPFEIWTHIASFLDWNAVERLFALNRFFFNYVLNARYGHVYLDEYLHNHDILKLKRLQ
jgi:hypothetical protein